MPLSGGTRLGPYEVVEPLGAGGMGEVYKSRDTRLGRTVALKVLSPSLAADPTWRQRFEREARIVATLSNPHICPVFDVGTENGVDFLVMEYLEGETLQARLATGPLPIDRALRFAIEIADALAVAHAEGVCHRDLKPGNIMLTRSGARLVDFGLARVGAFGSQPANQQTISSGLTEKGIILGTLQYMAPEQLEGKETDARTDIFAFGAVVYEMVTGQKAFKGHSQASVIAAILEHEPPGISSLQPLASPALDRAIRKCLAKDPEERWQNVRDLRDELKWIAGESSQRDTPVTAAAGLKHGTLLQWALIAILAAALLGVAAVHFLERSVPDPSRVVFTVARPSARFPFFAAPELAPDGKRLVFPGPTADGRMVLWLRALDSVTPRPLPGTENEGTPTPFWSPDGQSLAFFADRKLKRIDLSGGPAVPLADAPDPYGGTWGRDGTIVFCPSAGSLSRVPASGGVATLLREVDRSRHEFSHAWPHFLPDGRHFLYELASADSAKAGVYLASLEGEEPRLLTAGAEGAVYSPPGYIVFVREGTLFAQSFDPDRLQLTGERFAIPGQDGQTIKTSWGLFSVSRTGVLTYVATSLRNWQLQWYNREGKPTGAIGDPMPSASLALSPDETRLALGRSNGEIHVLQLATGIATQISRVGAFVSDPVWSSDGHELVFTAFDGYIGNLYRKALAGAEEELLFRSAESKYGQYWLRDGASIVFMTVASGLYQLPLAPEAKPRLLAPTVSKDEFHVSPDERWMAYNSLESGRWEVYVVSFPSFGDKHQVSSAGGCQPLWRKDGKELFYLDLHGKLMSVNVTTGATFDAGSPTPLFQTSVIVNPIVDQYAATGDGRRFILASPVGEEEPVTVIVNWASGLKR